MIFKREMYRIEQIAIYQIMDTLSPEQRVYVGKSIDYIDRWEDHCKDLRLGIHKNKFLQNTYKKRMQTAKNDDWLVFSILEILPPNSTDKFIAEKEEQWLEKMPFVFNYNLLPTIEKRRFQVMSKDPKIAKLQKLFVEIEQKKKESNKDLDFITQTASQSSASTASLNKADSCFDLNSTSNQTKNILPETEQNIATELNITQPVDVKSSTRTCSAEHKQKLSKANRLLWDVKVLSPNVITRNGVGEVTNVSLGIIYGPFACLKDFCKNNKLNYTNFCGFLTGRRKYYGDWKIVQPLRNHRNKVYTTSLNKADSSVSTTSQSSVSIVS